MIYTTAFRDVHINSVPNALFSGIASWEYDEVYEDYFVTKLEVLNLFGNGSVVNLTRRNKDQGLNVIFSEIEDVLLDHAVTSYTTPTQHYFYEALAQ